jgi:hypothetical protein
MLERHTKELLRHVGSSFLVVLVFFAFAIALDFVERLARNNGTSSWLCDGIGIIAKVEFTFTGIIFLATTGMTGTHFIRGLWRRLFNR